MKHHGTPSSEFTPRTAGTPAGRKQLPEWVVALVLVAVPTAVVGGWVACLLSSAFFGLFYVALAMYRARRARANN